jgi:hypothetical protein
MLTAGQSKISQGTHHTKDIEAMMQANKVTTDKNFKLVEYIKYDTTLGRE